METNSHIPIKPVAKVNFLTEHIALVISLITVSLLHLPLSVFPVGRDQGVWSTAGLAINNGAVFFKDYLHFNLPGLGFTYAFAMHFTDDPRVATMLVSLLGSVAIVIAMYLLLCQTIDKSAASSSVLLFSVMWPTYVGFWGIAQKDFMAMYGVLLGTWLMARSNPLARFRHLSIYAAGFAIGLATMYKPLFAITGILLAAKRLADFIILPTGDPDKKKWQILLYDLLLLIAGAMTVAMLFLYYLLINDAIGGLYHGLFVFAPAYSDLCNRSISHHLAVLFANSALVATPLDWSALIHYLAWTPIVFSGLLMLAKRACAKEKAWLYIPFLTALFTYLAQRKSFSYHTMPWQICLFMAAGSWLSLTRHAINDSRNRKKLTLLISFAVLIIFARVLFMAQYTNAEIPAWLNLVSRETYLENNYKEINPSVGIPSPIASEKMALWISQNSHPEDKILVWGLECQLYVLSKRMYATHSPFDFLLTTDLSKNATAFAWQRKIRQQFIERLDKEKPKFIIIVNSDINTVESTPSNEAVEFVPGLKNLLAMQYSYVKSIEPFDVYQLTKK